jgi:protein-tyrosine phosphatase
VSVENTFSVLFVCQANRYRSPLAEHFLRSALADRDVNWMVQSAGTRAVDGEPLDDDVVQILSDRGIEFGSWASQFAQRELLARFDLMLASDAAVRAEVVTRAPRSVRSVFTVRQFARLVATRDSHTAADDTGVSAPGRPNLLDLAHAARSRSQPVSPTVDDIADPAGHGRRRLRLCADSISASIDTIADAAARLREQPSRGNP